MDVHIKKFSYSTMLLGLIIACSVAVNIFFVYLLYDISNISSQNSKELKTVITLYAEVENKNETLLQDNKQLKSDKEALQKYIDNLPK